MRSVAWLALTLLLASNVANASLGSGEAKHWLERTAHALHALDYRGTFVYLHGTQLHAMRIIHRSDATGEHERLVSLTGSPREVLRDNNLVTCILPDSRSVVVERSRSARRNFPVLLPERIDQLERYYHFGMGEEDRVAGRATQRVTIQPLDDYRYGHEFWIDTETGLLLKADLVDEQGRPIEQFMFTDVEVVDEIPDQWLQPEISGEGFYWYHHKDEINEAMLEDGLRWEVAQLPDGFALEIYRRKHISASRAPVDHLVYSDGLTSVSVFIEPLEEEQPPLAGGSRMGAVNAYSTLFEGYQITVVGALPEAAVRMIGTSVRR